MVQTLISTIIADECINRFYEEMFVNLYLKPKLPKYIDTGGVMIKLMREKISVRSRHLIKFESLFENESSIDHIQSEGRVR